MRTPNASPAVSKHGETPPAVAVARPHARPDSVRNFALVAVASTVCGDAACGNESPEIELLLRHARASGVASDGWSTSLREYLARPGGNDAQVLALATAFGLSHLELLAVALAAAVEDDLMVGRALARLQAPVGGSRPTLGLLATAFAEVAEPGVAPIDLIANGPAVRSGLLTLLGDGIPLPERAVAVPLHLCSALAGRDANVPGATVGAAGMADVALPPSTLSDASRNAAALTDHGQRAVVLRTSSSAEGRAVAAAIARALSRRPLFIDGEMPRGLGPWLLLRQLLPVFSFDLAPAERKPFPRIPLYDGPCVVLCGPDGGVDAGTALTVEWPLRVPDVAEREQLWAAALHDEHLASELAHSHRHGSGRIAHLVRLVRHRAALSGREAPTLADVAEVSWTIEGGGLETLAEAITDRVPDEAFVMPPTLREEMQTLLLRCRARDGLVRDLGASTVARYRPGVRALFVGSSGTGKTLAAGWLATRLGLPLFRVDLANVTSKYIGETEKNLAQLFARAEQAEVILLFDEADSLFGKRTDIKEANDRFANAQTNYLLQRIESFEGITILTSNNRSRFDAAFARRLDMIIDFPLPAAEERRALWRSHLGDGHALTQAQLNQLAARMDLSGGHIRNAVLTAAVLARGGRRAIAWSDVLYGLSREYAKVGRQMPGTQE